jgi:DNA-binding CsgD family transcriptional regulator
LIATFDMRSQTRPATGRQAPIEPQPRTEPLSSGIVLMDKSLNPIASDTGADRILSSWAHEAGSAKHRVSIPEHVIDLIRSRPPAANFPVTTKFSIGGHRLRCRAYLAQSDHPILAPAIIAVHFETDLNGADPISDMASDYHLTKREEEALRGIAMGLTTKELADRMSISPNTVKAFVRMIMIKLGVESRIAIILRLHQIHGAE